MDAFIAKPITPAKIAAALGDLRGLTRAAPSIEVRTESAHPFAEGEIDLEMLRFLGNESPDGLPGQIDRFLTSFDADRLTASRIVESGTPAEIHRIAHRLLSHCSVVKHEALSQLAKQLQGASGTADAAALKQIFSEFERQYASFRYKLELIRASTGSA